MARKKSDIPTRQIYAAIKEDLYLAAKAKSTEMRMPLREFIEHALELALSDGPYEIAIEKEAHVWQDEYLRMQASQPLGSPVELTRDEAAKVVRGAFNF